MTEISMAQIARHGFGGLFDPRGRDARKQYWLFLLLVFGPLVVVQLIVQLVLTIPPLDLTAATHPRDPSASMHLMQIQLRAMVTAAYANIGLYLLGALLLLTATARRLHDRGRAGWWALALPGAIFATGLGQARRMAAMAEQMPQILAEMETKTRPDFADALSFPARMQASAGIDWPSIVGGLILLWLIVELVRAGTDAPNRYGPPPGR
ncbi:DUF805 domain-containing protein [Sphingopyxis sp. DBS4]|uniref:DUF805 domain-containing protein n=1 Tax=Sphingopyxis sp. DBS4 TaxID=2968500 RepID=UPI00214C4CB8|nr:DUF805 domain-containing protein [Sphingopyxis sp. DBS4]